MEEYFYLYHFVDKEHTKIKIVPEQEFQFRLICLRDLEGRLETENPIPLESSNDYTVDISQKEKLEQEYRGKFTPFKKEISFPFTKSQI